MQLAKVLCSQAVPQHALPTSCNHRLVKGIVFKTFQALGSAAQPNEATFDGPRLARSQPLRVGQLKLGDSGDKARLLIYIYMDHMAK